MIIDHFTATLISVSCSYFSYCFFSHAAHISAHITESIQSLGSSVGLNRSRIPQFALSSALHSGTLCSHGDHFDKDGCAGALLPSNGCCHEHSTPLHSSLPASAGLLGLSAASIGWRPKQGQRRKASTLENDFRQVMPCRRSV